MRRDRERRATAFGTDDGGGAHLDVRMLGQLLTSGAAQLRRGEPGVAQQPPDTGGDRHLVPVSNMVGP